MIITGFKNKFTPDWNERIANLKASAEILGHKVHAFRLPNEDSWICSHEDLYLSLCWKYKVIFMGELLRNLKCDFVWIDGDCLVKRPLNFDEIMDGCDIAFTLRDIAERDRTKEPLKDGYINSGVVFVKNNQKARDFMDLAKQELICSLYDQEAFNRVIIKHSKMENHGEIINIKGIRIKMLDCREYNNFYLDSSANSARILHFKGSGRGDYDKWLERLAQNV